MPDQTTATPPARSRRKDGVSIPARLAAALIGAGVLIGGIAGGVTGSLLSAVRGEPEAPPAAVAEPAVPTYSDQEVVEAKAKLCTAYAKVHQAVLVTTGRNGEEDQAMVFAIAANARLALFDGGGYLLAKLDETPAAPADLATAVRALAGAYQQLAIDYLAEVPEDEQQAALQAVDAANTPVFETCQ